MEKFVPRLAAPAASDKNWIHADHGGYNLCIHISGGSVLPNCVGYAWGRWRELLGKYHNLALTDAETWYPNTGDGYERGQTPKVGAVACWRKGSENSDKDGEGHVAIVEKVNADGSIVTSESSSGGSRWYTRTHKPPYNIGSTLVFQGFIYIPVEYETEDAPEPVRTEPAEHFDTGKIGFYSVTTSAGLHLRAGASQDKTSHALLDGGTTVYCSGGYTGQWLRVETPDNRVGFCHGDYLKKI